MIYAVYQGDSYLFDGTAEEVANRLKIKVESVKWHATPSGQQRAEKSKNRRVIIKLGE